MRGVRGGLKDQIKAFREFLIRRKKKRKKEIQLEKLKRKKEEEKKKNINFDYCEEIEEKLEQIIVDIYEEKKIDYNKVNNDLDIMKKDKKNVSYLDKIEEVKEKVEIEILYEEIIEENNNIKIDVDNSKMDRLIYLGEKCINNSNSVKEVKHYYNIFSDMYLSHIEKDKDIANKYIVSEERLLLQANSKLKVIRTEDLIEEIVLEDVIEKKSMSNNIILDDDVNKHSVSNIINSNDIEVIEDIEINELSDEKNLKNDNILDENMSLKDNLENYVNEELKDDEKQFFDFSEFDIINQSVKAQILISETKVNQLRNEVNNINDLFTKETFFDKLMAFSSNMFNLGRGLIGKYVFNNRLVGRLNSEVLINNSLKGIHRVFVDDKKEVPYIVFKGFEDEINDKKDCVSKILDICDDSLDEINNLKHDFLNKYGYISSEQVNDFLNKIDMYEKQIRFRKDEVLRIQKQVQLKYKENKQLVKVKK